MLEVWAMRMNDPAEGLNVCAARGSIEPIRLAAMTTPIGGQRRSPASRRSRGLPGAIRGFLWPTELLILSDFLVATPHTHSALQLSVGLSGAPRVQLEDAWQQACGVLIDIDVAHAFDCDGCLTAIGWIEGESRLGHQLRERVLGGAPYAILDDALCTHLADEIRPVLNANVGCADAYARWRRALGQLAIDIAPEPKLDRRVSAVLEHLRNTPSPPPSIDELARIAYLSESRLQHVFREQVGVPIRRYLLWHRYLTALSLLADGSSVTEAAHAAGFADSAHLTRTAVRMNGYAPTKMPYKLWLSNCR
jgi:AraC-like DNA-binding protein